MTVNDYWQRMNARAQDAQQDMQSETNLKATPSAQPDEQSQQINRSVVNYKQSVADSLLQVGGK